MNIQNHPTPTDITAWLGGAHCEILGFGVTGKALLPWLKSHGITSITVRDKCSLQTMIDTGDAQLIASVGASLMCGEDYLDGLGDTPNTLIFRSPGIRPDIPAITQALQKGARLTSEMEAFLTLTPARVIAVTGSDGKTTTTTLVSKMLGAQVERQGRGRVFLGGNIGIPLLPCVDDMTAEDFAVVELSSFQLMTMPPEARIHTAIITNITPNHLDWHTDMTEYITAKANIGKSHTLGRVVLNAGNPSTYQIGQEMGEGRVVWFSAKDVSSLPSLSFDATTITCQDGQVVWQAGQGTEAQICLTVKDILIPGYHNVENYMAAIGAVMGLLDMDVVDEIARTFKGVEHRLQLVREAGGVRFYNSSIDSTPSRTCAALLALRQLQKQRGEGNDPIVICGGRDKKVGFGELAEGLCRMASKVVITGEARDQIWTALQDCPLYDPQKLPVFVIPDYMSAMQEACAMAKAGDIVVLSPACTSFDAFKNYAQRGFAFAKIVEALQL